MTRALLVSDEASSTSGGSAHNGRRTAPRQNTKRHQGPQGFGIEGLRTLHREYDSPGYSPGCSTVRDCLKFTTKDKPVWKSRSYTQSLAGKIKKKIQASAEGKQCEGMHPQVMTSQTKPRDFKKLPALSVFADPCAGGGLRAVSGGSIDLGREGIPDVSRRRFEQKTSARKAI